MPYIIPLLLLFLSITYCPAQTARIDSLLAVAPSDLEQEFIRYEELIKAYASIDSSPAQLYYIQKGQERAKATKSWGKLADFWAQKGQFYLKKDSLLQAMEAFDKSLKISRTQLQANQVNQYLYINIGNLYFQKGYWTEANQHFNYALEGFLNKDDSSGINLSYRNKALVFNRLRQFDSVIYYTNLALPYIHENQLEEQFWALSLLGTAHSGKEEYNKAYYYKEKALDLAQEHTEALGQLIGYAHYSLGYVDFKLENYEQAIPHFQTALPYYMPRDFNALWQLIRCQTAAGQLQAAKESFAPFKEKYAYLLADSIQNDPKRDLYLLASQAIAEAEGDYKKAFELVKKINKDLREESRKEKDKDQLIRLGQLAFSLRKDIELKNQEQQLSHEKEVRAQKERLNQLYFLGLLMLLLLLFAGTWLYWQLAQNRKLLHQSYADLQEYSENQDELYAILAHDLRRPFGNLLSVNQRLAASLNQKKEGELARKAEGASQELYFLFEDLLSWIKEQNQGIQANYHYHSWAQLQADLLAPLQLALEEKNIQLQIRTELSELYTDSYLLNTILRNLLANAIRFSPKAGQISLIIQQKDNYYQIQLQDQGPGLSEEQIAALFTPNKKAKNGLGLPLAQKFVQLLGGEIELLSSSSTGLCFQISLPKQGHKNTQEIQEETLSFAKPSPQQRAQNYDPKLLALLAKLQAHQVGQLYALQQTYAQDAFLREALNELLELPFSGEANRFEEKKAALLQQLQRL